MTIAATVADATHLVLEKPMDLPPGARIQITVETENEREDFLRLSAENLERAYSNKEASYSASDLREEYTENSQ